MSDDITTCIACEKQIKFGDRVYDDASGGTIHAACCGPERESYTGPDGAPLKDGDPIPEPWVWLEKDEPSTSTNTPTPVPSVGEPVAWIVRDVLYRDQVFLDRQKAQSRSEEREMNSEIVPLYEGAALAPVPAREAVEVKPPETPDMDMAKASILWALKLFKDKQTPSELLATIFECPDIKALYSNGWNDGFTVGWNKAALSRTTEAEG